MIPNKYKTFFLLPRMLGISCIKILHPWMRKRWRKGALITSIDVMQKWVFSSIMRLLSRARAYARSQESTSISSQTAYVQVYWTWHHSIMPSTGVSMWWQHDLYQYQFITSGFTTKLTNINLIMAFLISYIWVKWSCDGSFERQSLSKH